MKLRMTLAALLLALSATPSNAQRWRRDLEDIERNRGRQNRMETQALSSVADAPDSLFLWDTDETVSGWEFLDEEMEELQAQAPQGAPALSSFLDPAQLEANLALVAGEFAVPWNATVESYVRRYVVKYPQSTAVILRRFFEWDATFREIFAHEGVPEDLVILTIIESHCNSRAVSPAGAAGMWQFMPSTARAYGLKVSGTVDERYDPVKTAYAAAKFLKGAYARYGSWPLAISSYNCGPGNVDKAIRHAGGSREYWDVYRYLPEETRGYLPSFLGALYAVYYHKLHGIEL